MTTPSVAEAIKQAAARWRSTQEPGALADYADEQDPHPDLSWSMAAGMNEQMERGER